MGGRPRCGEPATEFTKPFLLLIPGTLCDARMFARQSRALRSSAVVHCADYTHLRDVSSWIDRLLKRLPPTFSVAGFSLGGLLALEMLRRAPQRIDRVALISSNAQAASPKGARRSAWLHKLWQERGAGVVAKHVKPAYFHHEAKRRTHQQRVLGMALKTPWHSAFAQFDWAANRPQGFDALQAFAGPLLAVAGAKDRLCPPAWQRAMQQVQPRMTVVELQRCGHFVPLESPAQLNHALIHWLNKPVAASTQELTAITLGVL